MLWYAIGIAITGCVVIAFLRSRGVLPPEPESPELTREEAAARHRTQAQLADPDDPYGGYPPPDLPFSKRRKNPRS